MSRDRATFGQITLQTHTHIYIYTYIERERERERHIILIIIIIIYAKLPLFTSYFFLLEILRKKLHQEIYLIRT